MAGEQVTVTMTGGGPYGFRLFGGDNMPLSIAKVRRKSKSADAGLLEDDILLGINGYSCRGLSHGQAMGLSESSGDMLVFQVLRGAHHQYAVDAAFDALEGQLAPVSSGAHQHAVPALSVSPKPMINSHITPASHVSHQDHTYQEGNTTHRIQQDTRREQLGDTTFTQTTTQRISTTNLGTVSPRRTPSPMAQKQSMFQVSNFSTQAKPMNAWRPSSGHGGGGMSVSAPSNVAVQQHDDSSVTMTIGIPMEESKENVPPRSNLNVPQFKVSKVVTEQPKGLWTPGGGGSNAFVPQQAAPVRAPSPKVEIQQKWTPPAPAVAPPAAPQPAPYVPPKEPTPPPMMMEREPEPEMDFRDAYINLDEPPPMPIDIHKLMFGADTDRCSTPDSPGALHRKKIYADSSFYDDPQHKYPTIEEQIKMARKVAQSLMAPQNKRARGHTMFMRRRQKSDRWVAGTHFDDYDHMHVPLEPETPEVEKYYRPSPWIAAHTWHPPDQQEEGFYQPTEAYAQPQPQPQPQRAPEEPYIRSWGQPDIRASSWGHSEPQYGTNEPQAQQPQQPKPFQQPFQQPYQQPPQPDVSSVPQAPKPQPHTWQPGIPQQQAKPEAQVPSWEAQPQKPSWEAPAQEPVKAPPPPPPPPPPSIPPPPPLPDKINPTMWRTPQLPSLEDSEEKKASLSHDEFEKIRLFSQKNLHNQVSPQVCFDLANDLRNMKGKGGRLFAKRRARAEQWVVDEKPSQHTPSQVVMEKIVGQVAMQQAMQDANLKTGPMYNKKKEPVSDTPRLQEMIAKPAMTPWEAASSGNLDAAFGHLHKNDPFASSYTPSKPTAPNPSVSSTPLSSLVGTSSAGPSSGSSFGDYNRKVRGWGGGSYAPSSTKFSPVSVPSFNAKQQTGPSPTTSGASSSFLAPSDSHGASSGGTSPRGGASSPYQSSPQQISPVAPPEPAASPAGESEVYYDAPEAIYNDQGGFSDL